MWIDQKTKVFIYQKPIDMRWAFERLSFLIKEEMGREINEGDLFLFFGNNRRRLKALRYDGSGLVLYTKKTEKKSFMSVSELEGRDTVTRQELELLIHGSVLRKYLPDERQTS